MNCVYINLNYTLKVLLNSKEHLIPPRRHLSRRTSSYVLYFVTAGELCMKLNGESFRLGKGDVYIFNKGDLHAPMGDCDCEYFYLHFNGELQEQELSEDEMLNKIRNRNRTFGRCDMLDEGRYESFFALLPRHMHISDTKAFDYMVGEFKKMRLSVSDSSIERRLEIAQAAASALIKLERIVLDGYLSGRHDGYAQNLAAVKQLADYIEENYTKDICSGDIEREFALSYDYANRIFKRQKGMSIISYRNRLRIEKAKILLLTTDKTVECIADETGFGDKYYFSKFFKKAVGVSPTHFKRGENFAF